MITRTLKKLTEMPYAQAHIEIDEIGNTYLFSYVTCVAEITTEGWLTVYGLYSMTTRRHLGAFAHEYITYPNGKHGTYQDLKACYDGGYTMNLLTGEIEMLGE